MFQTVEALIHQNGTIELLEKINIQTTRRAIVTILDESNAEQEGVTLLSENALARDWLRPEEDKAWVHLQPAR